MRTRIVFGCLFALLAVVQAQAQTDPTLAGMILVYTDKAKDQLKAQEKTMMMQTTGHLWIREEVEATTGTKAKLARPLDFLVITDHSEGLGSTKALYDAPRIAINDPTLLR